MDVVDVSTEWILNISVILNATARDSTEGTTVVQYSIFNACHGLCYRCTNCNMLRRLQVGLTTRTDCILAYGARYGGLVASCHWQLV